MANLKTYNAAGGLQIDSEAIMYAFVGKQTVIGSTFWNTDVGQGQGFWGGFNDSLPEHQLVAVRSSNCAVVPMPSSPANWIHDRDGNSIASANGMRRNVFGNLSAPDERGVTVEMFFFSQYRYTPNSSAPFKLFNSAGVKTFDAGYPPLRIVGNVPITGMSINMSSYYSTGVPGRTLAYMSYGTVMMGGPAPTTAGADVPTGSVFNAALPGIRDAGNGQGFYVEDARGVGITDGSVFNGGVLAVDVTGS